MKTQHYINITFSNLCLVGYCGQKQLTYIQRFISNTYWNIKCIISCIHFYSASLALHSQFKFNSLKHYYYYCHIWVTFYRSVVMPSVQAWGHGQAVWWFTVVQTACKLTTSPHRDITRWHRENDSCIPIKYTEVHFALACSATQKLTLNCSEGNGWFHNSMYERHLFFHHDNV